MKKAMLASAVLILSTAGLSAQQGTDYGLGAGVVLGSPTGVTLKYFMSDVRALDFGVGVGEHTTLYADYLWHGWNVFPQPKAGRLAGYLGLGGRIETARDAQFGLRTVGGVGYWLANAPVEIFAELGPVFQLTDDTGVDVDGGIGVRYYFGPGAAKKL